MYRVNDALLDRTRPPSAVFARVLAAMPDGWQHPDTTTASIVYLGRRYDGEGFGAPTSMPPARLRSEIQTWGATVGHVEVADSRATEDDEGAFLTEERELLNTIAARLGDYLEWKQQELTGEPIGATQSQWRWRHEFSERLAKAIEPTRFGVEAVYLTGSTERGDAAPASDIDLAIVFTGTPGQRHDLVLWLEGWSLCLAEVAYRHGGSLVSGGLLDIQWLSKRPSAATTWPMRELPLG